VQEQIWNCSEWNHSPEIQIGEGARFSWLNVKGSESLVTGTMSRSNAYLLLCGYAIRFHRAACSSVNILVRKWTASRWVQRALSPIRIVIRNERIEMWASIPTDECGRWIADK
jgi:hypothetical protein